MFGYTYREYVKIEYLSNVCVCACACVRVCVSLSMAVTMASEKVRSDEQLCNTT